MRKCIDVSDNKKLGAVSPVAMFAFAAIFIVLTAVMKAGFLYFILVFASYVLTQIFFQYTPRYVLLTLKFLVTNSYLTPSFEDFSYIADETKITGIANVLPQDNSDEYY